jgi:hypothetical protein
MDESTMHDCIIFDNASVGYESRHSDTSADRNIIVDASSILNDGSLADYGPFANVAMAVNPASRSYHCACADH